MDGGQMTVHDLKIWPQYFDTVLSCVKTFEARKADRDYRVGDHLVLREWSKIEEYTGREVIVRITYILDGELAIPGFCIMAIKRVF
jgi:hypothetical protein